MWQIFAHGRHRFTFDWMPMVVRDMSWRQRLNVGLAGLNLFHRRARPWAMPLHMQIEVTNYCNLRCPVCPTGSGALSRKPKAMEVDLFERLFEEVGPTLLTAALFAWGEPLLHPQLGKLLAIARRYPATILVSTNGQNLHEPAVQAALREHPPTYLVVALDGLTDATNAIFRKGARLSPVWAGVRQLVAWKRRTLSHWPVLHLRFMAMKHNQHDLPEIRRTAYELGFDMVSIRSLSTVDSVDQSEYDALLPDAEELRAYQYQDGHRVRRDDFICQNAFNYPTVLADGTVVACEQDHQGSQPYGVFSQHRSFRSLWRGKVATRVRVAVRDDPSRFSFCRSCPFADRASSNCSVAGYPLRPFSP